MRRTARPRVIKKYGNRRLYDTDESRYVTLDELAECVRAGNDVRVVDARDESDLTQATLTQIILEGRGAAQFLSVPILTQLVRMNDDALADFLGRYVTAALTLYQQTRSDVQGLGALAPFAVPYAATGALARMVTGLAPGMAPNLAPLTPLTPLAPWAPALSPAPHYGPALDTPPLDSPPLDTDPHHHHHRDTASSDADPAASLDALRRKLEALERTVQAQKQPSPRTTKKPPTAPRRPAKKTAPRRKP